MDLLIRVVFLVTNLSLYTSISLTFLLLQHVVTFKSFSLLLNNNLLHFKVETPFLLEWSFNMHCFVNAWRYFTTRCFCYSCSRKSIVSLIYKLFLVSEIYCCRPSSLLQVELGNLVGLVLQSLLTKPQVV